MSNFDLAMLLWMSLPGTILFCLPVVLVVKMKNKNKSEDKDESKSENENKKVEKQKKIILEYEGPGSIVITQFKHDWKLIVKETLPSQRGNFSISYYGDNEKAIKHFEGNKILTWPKDAKNKIYSNSCSAKNISISNLKEPLKCFPDWVETIMFASDSWAPLKLSVSFDPLEQEQEPKKNVDSQSDAAKIAALIEADSDLRNELLKFGIFAEVVKDKASN
jgi:hypothetical protein